MSKNILLALLCISVFLCGCSDNGSSDSDSDINSSVHSQQDGNIVLPCEYERILNDIVNAYPWDDDEMELIPGHPELSYMYHGNSALSEIGFAVMDLDGNGQMELILSDVNKPFLYDLYTISDGEAVHLAASGERYCYYLRKNGYIEIQWSGSAVVTGHDFYTIHGGQLDFVERITLDAHHALDIGLIDDFSEASDDNCYFRSRSNQEKDYEWVSFHDAMDTIEAYRKANRQLTVEYTLLSQYKTP